MDGGGRLVEGLYPVLLASFCSVVLECGPISHTENEIKAFQSLDEVVVPFHEYVSMTLAGFVYLPMGTYLISSKPIDPGPPS